LLAFYEAGLAAEGVELRLGQRANDLDGFDAVVLATGAEETSALDGAELSSAVIAAGPAALAGVDHVVIVDDGFAGWPGCNLVELALEAGVRRVTFLSPGTAFAAGIPVESRVQLLQRLAGAGELDIVPMCTPVARAGSGHGGPPNLGRVARLPRRPRGRRRRAPAARAPAVRRAEGPGDRGRSGPASRRPRDRRGQGGRGADRVRRQVKQCQFSLLACSRQRSPREDDPMAAGGGDPKQQVEDAVERIRALNEQVLTAGRELGQSFLDAYEQSMRTFAEFQERSAEGTDLDWVVRIAKAQADFTREVTKSSAEAARRMLQQQ
jgi:hypothetical protein